MCNNSGVHACSGCHSIRYCSILCQKTDWLLHKLLCKSFKNFSNNQRPQPHGISIYKRAIHFPEHGDTPQFVWMRHLGPNKCNGATVEPSSLPADCEELKPLISLIANPVLQRPLPGCVGIAARSWGFSRDGTVKAGHRNKSILKVNEELSDWVGGAMIAYGNDGFIQPTAIAKGAWQDQVYDLEPVHLRHVVDALRVEYYKTGREFELHNKVGEEKVKGVRMNCLGDQTVCCRDAIEPMDVARSMCTKDSDLSSEVADKIGVPMVICKIPHALCWRDRNLTMRNSPGVVPCGLNTAMLLFDL